MIRKDKKTNSSGPNSERAAYHFSDLLHPKGKRAGKLARKVEELKNYKKAKEELKKPEKREPIAGVGASKPFRDAKYHKSPHTLSKIKNKKPVKDISSHAILNNKTGTIHSHKLVNEKERNSSFGFYQNKGALKSANRFKNAAITGASSVSKEPKPVQPRNRPFKKGL
ncbi:MAG: hypothetical protein GXC78_11195 [Chitinophagaceae bacterium]|nr:hypothetical protein [Chitinophagaceae bacterium]